jgi:hypothetical protein
MAHPVDPVGAPGESLQTEVGHGGIVILDPPARLIRLLENDGGGILRTGFTPMPPIAPSPGQFGLADFLVYAGVTTRP